MFTYDVAREPGTAGYAMVSDRFLAVLDASAGDAAALRLWHALTSEGGDAGAVAEALADPASRAVDGRTAPLSSPPASLPSAPPAAAVVELLDASTRSVALAVRGDASIVLADAESSLPPDVAGAPGAAGVADVAGPAGVADVAGAAGAPRLHRGSDDGSWHESTVAAVTGLVLRLGVRRRTASEVGAGAGVGFHSSDGVAPASRLPLGRGIVRADLLRWGAAPTAPDERTDEPVDEGTDVSRQRRRSRGRAVLRIGADRVLDLDRPVVLGRSPRPAAHPGARLVTLPSPRREISGTHLEVRHDGDGVVARDLGSTNGTIVRLPEGESRLLRHGAAARLAPGASLDLGDGAIAVVDLDEGTG